jgi:tight adherence protein B
MTARRRQADLAAGLPDLLERVAAELRAGGAPLSAMAEAAKGPDLPEALVADVTNLVERAEQNGLEAVLASWAAERPLPVIATVAAALTVAGGTGGPAAPALEGLAGGLRDRQDAAAEVAALSAQARMSALVVGAAPVLSLGLSALADPRVASTLVSTGAGLSCFMAGATLEALAALWMRRIVRCEL